MKESAKRTIRFFVSYTRSDQKLKNDLVGRLQQRLCLDSEFDFQLWQDNDILVGERWHEQIQQALIQCDFGLLFVSYNFFNRKYIRDHELPQLMAEDAEGRCKALPVGLCDVALDGTLDLLGVDQLQIFRDEQGRSFDRCKGTQKDDFAERLRIKLREVAKKVPTSPKATAEPARSSEPISVTAVPATPIDDQLKGNIRESLTEEDLEALGSACRGYAETQGVGPGHGDLADLLYDTVVPLDLALGGLTRAAQERTKALARQKSDDLPAFRERIQEALGWLLLRAVDPAWVVRHRTALQRAQGARVHLRAGRPSCVEVAISRATVRSARFSPRADDPLRCGERAIRLGGETGFEPSGTLNEVLAAMWQQVVRRPLPRDFPGNIQDLRSGIRSRALALSHYHLTVDLSDEESAVTSTDIDDLQEMLPGLHLVLIRVDGETALLVDETDLDWQIRTFFDLVIPSSA